MYDIVYITGYSFACMLIPWNNPAIVARMMNCHHVVTFAVVVVVVVVVVVEEDDDDDGDDDDDVSSAKTTVVNTGNSTTKLSADPRVHILIGNGLYIHHNVSISSVVVVVVDDDGRCWEGAD